MFKVGDLVTIRSKCRYGLTLEKFYQVIDVSLGGAGCGASDIKIIDDNNEALWCFDSDFVLVSPETSSFEDRFVEEMKKLVLDLMEEEGVFQFDEIHSPESDRLETLTTKLGYEITTESKPTVIMTKKQ